MLIVSYFPHSMHPVFITFHPLISSFADTKQNINKEYYLWYQIVKLASDGCTDFTAAHCQNYPHILDAGICTLSHQITHSLPSLLTTQDPSGLLVYAACILSWCSSEYGIHLPWSFHSQYFLSGPAKQIKWQSQFSILLYNTQKKVWTFHQALDLGRYVGVRVTWS
jgi:hypothetical protein